MTLALEKGINDFVPGYVKAHDGKMNGQQWELVYSFREIPLEDLQELAIKRVEQLVEMEPMGKK